MLANGDGLESDTTEDVPHFELDMDSISSDDYEMDEVMSMISLPDIEEPRTPHSVWSFGVSRSGSLWEELPRLSRWVKAVKGLFPIFGRL